MIASGVNVRLAYLGRSELLEADGARGQTVQLEPNLAREPVAFDAPLLQPLRFREAISALHDVVVSDLRFKKKDKTAYLKWKQDEQKRLAQVRREAFKQASADVLARQAVPLPPDFQKTFERSRRRYWDARQKYSDYLRRHDMELWRLLVPCDPVITVADDSVFFECFSGDESSYGCLSVLRGEGFGKSEVERFGTTNVDYSWPLYHHFQGLRSYRETRFRIDPAGFEVATHAQAQYHEEKIDLPLGWLQGFMQISSAGILPPAAIVRLSRQTVYSILAWLKRHKAYVSPRAIRFDLLPGKPVRIVIEPWNVAIVDYTSIYDGPPIEPVRVWGAKRLLAMARLLPLAEQFDVHLLGTGLPHFWVARMGEMTLTLGLSGWTTNDWTRAAAMDLVYPYRAPNAPLLATVADSLQRNRRGSLTDIAQLVGNDQPAALGALRHLAQSGQVVYDLPNRVYRWRQVMPQALGEAQLGPPHPELLGLHTILGRGKLKVESIEQLSNGTIVATAKGDGTPCEVLVDRDGRVRRGKCMCGYYRQYGLKNGPCRHMMAMRWNIGASGLG